MPRRALLQPTHDGCKRVYNCDHCGRDICRDCCRGVHSSLCRLCYGTLPSSLPDFPGDGPFDLRTIMGPPPCFCCGGYHYVNLTGEQLREVLLRQGPTRRI